MQKTILAFAAAAAFSFTAVGAADANGWGTGGQRAFSSGGLVNVSPSVNLGSVNVGNGILSGLGVGILGSAHSGNSQLVNSGNRYNTSTSLNSGNRYNMSAGKSGSRGRR